MHIKFLGHIKKKWNDWRQRKKEKNNPDVSINTISYNSLTPTADAKDCEPYLGALSWALKQEDVHNIAISGPYGSGKSSVIKTFFKKNPTYKHITISLANFKSDNDTSKESNKNNEAVQDDVKVKKAEKEQQLLSRPSNPQLPETDLGQQIERSIVQQLFYHEKDSSIPDSHFQKIKKQDSFELFCTGLFVILFLLSVFYVAFPDKFWSYLYIVHPPKSLTRTLQLLALSAIVIGVYKIIVHVIKITVGLSVRHFHFKNAEVALEKKEDKSILNYYIDEIIYFFEATEHNIVIIEDLDRFNNKNIFVKLREINYLINHCNKVEQKVTFIYAIKDEMFIDKDRTKFFDFIIPIIPVVNYSNSGEILRNDSYIKEQSIEHQLIDDLSLFIDDMRLLHNIINEFKIYSQETNASLPDKNGLLAMIAYKNLYPKDFTLLSYNKGLLYNIINGKQTYINNIIEQKDKKILDTQNRIDTIENSERPLNLKELRTLYLSKILKHIGPPIYFTGFNVKDSKHTMQECAENDELFEAITKQNSILYYGYRPNYGREMPQNLNVGFQDIEKEVNPILSYKQRVDLLNKTELEVLRQTLEQLRAEKEYIISQSLQELLSKHTEKIIDTSQYSHEQETQLNCATILLRDGYIKENYWDYISIFHEGSLTLTDKQFLINVKLHKPTTDYAHKLQRVENLVKQIPANYFGKLYILNNDLVDFMLSEQYAMVDETEEKKNNLFTLLAGQRAVAMQFAIQYLERYQHIDDFLYELCERSHFVWKLLNKSFKEEQLNDYFQRLIKSCSTEGIVNQFYTNNSFIENYADFMLIDCENSKLKEVVEKLNVKFVHLSPNTSKEDVQFIYNGQFYALNVNIMRFILSSVLQEWNDSAFHAENYTYIYEYAPEMLKYIESHLSEYLNNVYLKFESSQHIKSSHLVELINNEKLAFEQREQIIQKSECKIENITDITDTSLRNEICRQNKMSATWENIRTMINEDEESKSACDIFLNIKDNAQKLSSIAPQKEEQKPDDDNLFFDIMFRNEINDESYALLMSHANFNCSDFEEDEISETHMQILVDLKIVTASNEGFQYLKKKHPNLRISLLKHVKDFREDYSKFNFDAEDIELILQSSILDTSEKRTIINSISSLGILIENDATSQTLTQWLLSDTVQEETALKPEIMNFIVKQQSISLSNRKQLYIKYASSITDIKPFLQNLGKPFSELADGTGKVHIPQEDKQLLDTLRRKRYVLKCQYSPWNKKYNIMREWIIFPKE